jgi:hypothetical protein
MMPSHKFGSKDFEGLVDLSRHGLLRKMQNRANSTLVSVVTKIMGLYSREMLAALAGGEMDAEVWSNSLTVA